MARREPTPVYQAANNLEAHFLCGLLLNCGIEAVVVESISHHGESASTILIDRSEVEQARPIFIDFEQRLAERYVAANSSNQNFSDQFLVVTCEECGVDSTFPVAQYGLIQSCPRCRAYLDVGDAPFDDWNVSPGQES
jgi:hypothetical protein